MADGVDTAVEAMQPAEAHATADRIATESEREQLPTRDDAVLGRRERRDLGVDSTRSTLYAHIARFVERVGHAPIVAKQSRQRTGRIAPGQCRFRAPLTRGRRVG
jgi:hypothetical protein